MSREIKFRVWTGREMFFPPPLGEWDDEDNHFFFAYNKKPSVLMQFTGLKDKNGKDIFEGDIIKFNWRGKFINKDYWFPVFQVVFDVPKFELKYVGGDNPSDSWDFKFKHRSEKFKVIGNIYENPELLK